MLREKEDVGFCFLVYFVRFPLSSRASLDESLDSSGAPRDLQFTPPFGQVLPRRILLRNQRQTLRTRPRLNLLLAGNCVSYLMKCFVVHQPVDVVALRETINFSGFVLQRAAIKAIRDSRVEIQRPTGNDVNVISSLLQLQIPRLLRSG